jgi:hypothetical protein
MKLIKYILGTVAVSMLAVMASTQASLSQPKVLWHNKSTGELSAWLLSANGDVTGKQALSWKCDAASSCTNDWSTVGLGDIDGNNTADVLWHNKRTGELSAWLLSANGDVTGKQALSWKCDAASSCTDDWNPVGFGDIDGNKISDVLWHNKRTGELSAWLLSANGNVTGKQALSWKCDAASGCSNDWSPVGLGNIDGNNTADVLWHNKGTGELSAWLLAANGDVTGKQALSWKCDAASSCTNDWNPVGLGDIDGNKVADVLWHNKRTGELSAWLLSANGNVTGKQALSWKCDAASGCSSDWSTVGTASK